MRTDAWTNMTKLIVALGNFANAPKNTSMIHGPTDSHSACLKIHPLYRPRTSITRHWSLPWTRNIPYTFLCGASTVFLVTSSPYGASRSHSLDTPHSVGLLWTSDQADAKTFTWRNTTLTRDTHPCPRRDSNQQSQKASGRRPMA